MQKIYRVILVLFFIVFVVGVPSVMFAANETGELCQYCESDTDCPDSYCDGECCVDSSEDIECDECASCPDGYDGCVNECDGTDTCCNLTAPCEDGYIGYVNECTGDSYCELDCNTCASCGDGYSGCVNECDGTNTCVKDAEEGDGSCVACSSNADCPDSYCDGECCVDSSEDIECDECAACPDGYSGCVDDCTNTDTCQCDVLCSVVDSDETGASWTEYDYSEIDHGPKYFERDCTKVCAGSFTNDGCASAGDECSGCSAWETECSDFEMTGVECDSGYYLAGTECEECPSDDSYGASATSEANNTSGINSCYVPKGSIGDFVDGIGGGYVTYKSDCYHD